MTRDEFHKKYGDVVVTFSYYYKYTFTYKAVLEDGSILSVGYGGNSDEIYRLEVSSGEQLTVNALVPYCGSVIKDGAETDGFYDY